MTYTKTFSIQKVSADIDEARIVTWAVAPGTPFKAGDTLLEIETDKSVIEVAAEEDGILQTQLFGEGEVIAFDAPIAEIEVEGEPPKSRDSGLAHERRAEQTGTKPGSPEPGADPTRQAPGMHTDAAPVSRDASMDAGGVPLTGAAGVNAESAALGAPAGQAAYAAAMQAEALHDRGSHSASSTRLVATPAARSLAAQAGLELDPSMGTGPGGRITRGDVAAALGSKGAYGRDVLEARAPGAGMPDVGAPGKLVATRHGDIHLKVRKARQAAMPQFPTAVLLHGMFGDMDTWAALASTLSAAGIDVVMLDLPGHGESPSNASTVEQVVEAVADVLEETVSGPVGLIGHSFGAAIAARLAGRLHTALHSLSLIAPVGLGTEIGQSFLNGMTNAHTEAAIARELRKLTESSTSVSPAYLRTLRSRLADRQQVLAALCTDIARNGVQQIDISPDLAVIRRPVTLIHGRNDGIVPWSHALNAAPRTALHLIPGVGHMPQWEAPGVSAEIILGTLKRP